MSEFKVEITVRGFCTEEDIYNWLNTITSFSQDAEDNGIDDFAWEIKEVK